MVVLSAASVHVSLGDFEAEDDDGVGDGDCDAVGDTSSPPPLWTGATEVLRLRSSFLRSASASASSVRLTCGAISGPRRWAITPPSEAQEANK